MFFSNSIPKHLPKAYGNYIPGIMDVMLDYAKTGLFLRFYYPTSQKIKIETDHKKWPQVYPDYDYISGMGAVAMIPQFILYLLWLKSGNWSIPALFGERVKNDAKLKCILFSHGLGAFRGFSSSICIELASRGYLVVVIEHRDESACHTYYYDSKEDAETNKKNIIEFKQVQLGKGHYEVRREQVRQRAEEMCRTLDFLIDLNNGIVPHNVILDTLQQENNDIHFNLADFIGKIDLDHFTASGHSFGGATALLAMSKRQEFKQGLLLDPWMYSIKGEDLVAKLTQPLFFINTQTFHIATNVKAMEPYLNDEKTREMVTILRSTHENQTDLIFMAGYWLNWFMKKIDAKQALLINNALALKFLRERTGHEETIKDCESCLKDNDKHFIYGLTKPWA